MLPTTDAVAKALYWQKQADKTVGLVAAFETYYYNNQLQLSQMYTGEEAIKLVVNHDANSYHLLHTFQDENKAKQEYDKLYQRVYFKPNRN